MKKSVLTCSKCGSNVNVIYHKINHLGITHTLPLCTNCKPSIKGSILWP